MFKALTNFCQLNGKRKATISIATLDYLERLSPEHGITIAEVAENENEKAAMRKLLRTHKVWFRFKDIESQDYQGRPARKIFLTKKGRRFLHDARLAYKQGLMEDD